MIRAFAPENLRLTVAESVVTAVAATAAISLELPPWAMFVGWIAYFTRGLGWRNGLINFGCVMIGLILGIGTGALLGKFGHPPTLLEQFVVIFGVALVVLSLRFLPRLNNLLGFFLGLVTWFAARLDPGVEGILSLVAAVAIGSLAGWVAHSIQRKWASST